MNQQNRLPAPAGTGYSGPKAQIAVLIMLNSYGIVGSVFISRAILKALEISDRYWVGRQIFRMTDPFARILEILPGATTLFIGHLSLADITLVICVILFPLGVLGFSGRGR